MPPYWQPGVEYNAGDVVEYEHDQYRAIQEHRSQSDWAPSSATCAIWGKIPHEEHKHHDHEHDHNDRQQENFEKPLPSQPQEGGYTPEVPISEEKKWDEHSEQKVDLHPEEHKKKWWDIRDDRKKQLEVGGALALGLIAAAGAGYYVHHKNEQNEDKKKANVWGLQSWLKEAQARTDEYLRHGPKSPFTWVLVEGHNIPDNAFIAGEEGGKKLFVARAYCDGGLQVGKAGAHLGKGAVYGYNHKAYEISKYEILVGSHEAGKWVPTGGQLWVDRLNANPVEAGHTSDDAPLYIAIVDHYGRQPGSVSTNSDGAWIAYGDDEVNIKEYSVLCYA